MPDEAVWDRLASTMTVDITTIGRRSGQMRRIEIWAFVFEDRYIITGTPGPRDWLANLRADPSIWVHLPGGPDLSGTAQEVDDEMFKRRFFESGAASWYRSMEDLDRLVETAPMIEVTFDD